MGHMPAHQLTAPDDAPTTLLGTKALSVAPAPAEIGTWGQINVQFLDWENAAATAQHHLRPVLEDTTDRWWFIRKHPCWRIRYQAGPEPERRLRTALRILASERIITAWHQVIYEPETRAFGGPAAMALAHDLFSHDSPVVLDLLTTPRADTGVGPIEASFLALGRMHRAAGLDWFEQGDVWGQVADLRRHPGAAQSVDLDTAIAVRRLLTLDTDPRTRLITDGPLNLHARWLAAYHDSGTLLGARARTGDLDRGLRAVLAQHVIFQWNRLGVDARTQLALALTARDELLPGRLE